MRAGQIIGTILPILGRFRIWAFHGRWSGVAVGPPEKDRTNWWCLTVQEDPQDLPGCEKQACCEHHDRSKGHQNTSSVLEMAFDSIVDINVTG